MAELPEARSSVVIDGRYQLGARLGGDATTDLYAAHHVRIPDRRLVIRVLKRELDGPTADHARFQADARRLGAVTPAVRRVSLDDFLQLSDGRIAMVLMLHGDDVTVDEVIAFCADLRPGST